MLDKGICLRFYKRKDIQDAMLEHAWNKEIAVRYGNGFGKRPDILTYPDEILELAKQGVTSFHCSEELWDDPLYISSDLIRKELDELRKGWDLLLDIDCKFVDYSKICADLIIKFFKYCGVKDYSCKFSGSKGFHIGVPFEAFPQTIADVQTKTLFPEAARKIAYYIKENIKEELSRRVFEFEDNSFSKIREKVELPQEDIIRYETNEYGDKIAKLDVDKFLEIDTILISSRHLYRMPYSLHEKSGLASLPIDPDKVMDFTKSMANPDKILVPMFKFMDRNVSGESARKLLMQSLDFKVKVEEDREIIKESYFEEIKIESPITEEFFPPCIKQILENNLEDGKKRAVFILSNFLGKIGWDMVAIKLYLLKWNKKNKDPLRDHYITGQLKHFTPGAKLPPNCDNDGYYKAIGVCHPDALCGRLKNPVNYTLLRWRRHLRDREYDKGKRSSKSEDVKDVKDVKEVKDVKDVKEVTKKESSNNNDGEATVTL